MPFSFGRRKEISGLTKEVADRVGTAQHLVHLGLLCSGFTLTDEDMSTCQSHTSKLAKYVNAKLPTNAKFCLVRTRVSLDISPTRAFSELQHRLHKAFKKFSNDDRDTRLI